MEEKNIRLLIEKSNTPVVDAMKKIDENAMGMLLIVDDLDHLIGAISDGDIRRWIIKTGNLSTSVGEVMNKAPKYILEDGLSDAEKILKKYKIRALPVVDTNMRIIDIIFENDNIKIIDNNGRHLKGVPVVIMAGGKGTRLYPYTKILPKPLIPIGDIPIAERIINRFTAYGIEDFYFTINYRGGMIRSYFNDLSPEYNVHYVDEDIPLGTAGSIRLINEDFDSSFIVSNCDILIDADYYQMYRYHVDSGNVLTAVAAMKNIYVPYGVFSQGDDGTVKAIKEKPRLSYLINTGMYILSPEIVDMIPKDTFFHMTDLIELLIKGGKKVGMYPISEDAFWDMGEFEEMQRMEEHLLKSN